MISIKTARDWTEKITGVNVKHLYHGGFWITLGQAATSLSGLAMALFFANIIPKEIYGTYKYILSLVSIVAITTLPGINGPAAQAIAEGYEASFLTALRSKIKWGYLGGLLMLGIGAYYLLVKGNILVGYAAISAAIFVPFMDSYSLYLTYLQAKGFYKKSVVYFIISQLTATTLVILAAYFSKNLIIILLTYFGSWTALRYLFFKHIIRLYPPNNKESSKTTSYGFHINLVNTLGQFANYIDSLLLFNYLGPLEVAIYNISIAPTEQVRGILKDIPAYTLPLFAKKTIKEINRTLIWRMFLFFVGGVVVSFGIYKILPYIFPIVFKNYAEDVYLAQLYAPTLIFRAPFMFLSSVIQAKITYLKKSWLNYTIIPNIILIVSLFILIPHYGILGVIIARYINIIALGVIYIIQWNLLVNSKIE